MIKWLIMVMIMVTILYPSDWRLAEDTSEFTMDKQAHFVGSFGLYFMFRHKDFSKLDSFKLEAKPILLSKISTFCFSYTRVLNCSRLPL